jgi:hypothetical protein
MTNLPCICAVERLLSLGADACSGWTPRKPPNAKSWRTAEAWPWLPADEAYHLGTLTDLIAMPELTFGGALNALHIGVGAHASPPASPSVTPRCSSAPATQSMKRSM